MIPIYSVSEVACAERALYDNGETTVSLMRRAGDGLFREIIKQGAENVMVFVGKGNNGGDGFVVALNCLEAGKSVCVIRVAESLSPASRFYASQYLARGGRVEMFDGRRIVKDSLIVDCIFGVGFHGEVTGDALAAVNFINEMRSYGNIVVSVDIPSGLNGDSGLYTNAVKADITLAVGCVKKGLILNAAKDVVGRLKVVDIGLNAEKAEAFLTEACDFAPILTPRPEFSHKNDFGTVGVFGGSKNYCGAPKLSASALAALYAGAGIARVIVPEIIYQAIAASVFECTVATAKSDDTGAIFDKKSLDEALKGLTALSVGMGMGAREQTFEVIKYILSKENLKLCIDADGLNCLAGATDLLSKRQSKTIITPHIGEFCRLTGLNKDDVISDPIGHAKIFAAEHNCIVLLKGTSTVVTDGFVAYICNQGTAGMATAGSGDVLSGVIAGLLGYSDLTPLTVACASFIVGYAAVIARYDVCDISMTSATTVGYIQRAVTEIYNEINKK